MKMELFTKRCVIRNFRPEDSEDLYNVLSDAEVMKYIEPVFDMEKRWILLKMRVFANRRLFMQWNFQKPEG